MRSWIEIEKACPLSPTDKKTRLWHPVLVILDLWLKKPFKLFFSAWLSNWLGRAELMAYRQIPTWAEGVHGMRFGRMMFPFVKSKPVDGFIHYVLPAPGCYHPKDNAISSSLTYSHGLLKLFLECVNVEYEVSYYIATNVLRGRLDREGIFV